MHDVDTARPLMNPDWRKLVEAMPAAVYTCDITGRVSFFNQAAADLWGRRPQLGVDLWCGSWRIYRPDGTQLPLEQCPMALTLNLRQPVRGAEIIIERPDGVRRHVRPHPELLFDAAGEVVGAVNVLVDVTEHLKADEARHRLAAIVRYSDDAIVSKDLNGVITSWNRGAESLFGYTAVEAIGHPVTMLIPAERIDEEPSVLSRIRAGESIEHYETIRQRKDGSRINISLTVSPIFDAQGRIVGASKIARDITDRKSAEQALVLANRRKDEFLAILAHELRNPLVPLRSSVDLLRLKGQEGVPSSEVVEVMDRQISHLVRLVDDLMELSRISRGAIELKREVLDLSGVLHEAIEVSGPQLESRHHRLELALPQVPVPVMGDRTRLVQIFTNLLNNAAKFTAPEGHIRLLLERHEGQARVRVADNGIGIAPEMQSAVFDMFTQVRQPSSGLGAGLGIGLSLVRRLAEMHGGAVEVHSEGPGRGSEFSVSLPLAAELSLVPEAVPAATEAIEMPRRRVLVVDDNHDAAECVAALLRSLGHEVRSAHSGAEALDCASQLQPELILLDIGMPEMNGREVARRLRRLDWAQSTLLVAVTGWGDNADRLRSAECGFNRHLVKPVDFDSLQQLLAECPSQPLQ